MQLSLFDEVIDSRQEGIEFVIRIIVHSDSTRSDIKQAIKNSNKRELIKLFNESIRTFGFSGPNYWGWHSGELTTPDRNQTFEVTADELADTALKMNI